MSSRQALLNVSLHSEEGWRSDASADFASVLVEWFQPFRSHAHHFFGCSALISMRPDICRPSLDAGIGSAKQERAPSCTIGVIGMLLASLGSRGCDGQRSLCSCPGHGYMERRVVRVWARFMVTCVCLVAFEFSHCSSKHVDCVLYCLSLARLLVVSLHVVPVQSVLFGHC